MRMIAVHLNSSSQDAGEPQLAVSRLAGAAR